MSNRQPEWDILELIKRAGGPVGIRRKALDFGYKVPNSTQIYMWQKRDSIPSDWIAVLLLLAEARGELTAPKQVIMNTPTDPDISKEDFDPFA